MDHSPEVNIAVDQYNGRVYTYKDVISPASATDNYNRDVLRSILEWDGSFYEGWRGDYIELDFGEVREDGRLVIVADPLHGRPPLQKTRIFIYVWDGRAWTLAGTLHHRLHFATDVIDLSAFTPNEQLRVRMVGADNFRVERVGLDTSLQESFTVQEAPLLDAVHSSGEDVVERLASADTSYALLVPGEEILLSFGVPSLQPDQKRSFVLVARGHYRHKYQPLQGTDISIDGRTVTFNAIIPQKPLGLYWDVEIVELQWDFGDQTRAKGTSVAHVYGLPGEYTVRTLATYKDGRTKLQERRIVVS